MTQAEETKGVPRGEGRVVGAPLYYASVAVGRELYIPGASRAGKPVRTPSHILGSICRKQQESERRDRERTQEKESRSDEDKYHCRWCLVPFMLHVLLKAPRHSKEDKGKKNSP